MSPKPTFFVWKDAFALGIPAIDAEHQQFFVILNRCAEAASSGAASLVQVERLLQELETYARFHFRNEEEALERIGYPGLESQRQEHRRFQRELERIRALERPSSLAALALARDWLLNHVTDTDRRYVDWLVKDRPAFPG